MLGILALPLVKDHWKTKDQLKSFEERIINCTYTIEEHLLGIAVCSLIMLNDYPQSLTNADVLGQGNLNLVSEKSGKSQGILLSIICGNPALLKLVSNVRQLFAADDFSRRHFSDAFFLALSGLKRKSLKFHVNSR